jgi:hypothetical protein
VPFTRTFAQLRPKFNYSDFYCQGLQAIEEEGTKQEEIDRLDGDRCQIQEECQAKISKKYGYCSYNKEAQYSGTIGTSKGPKLSNSTLDTMKGKRLAHHNRNDSWVISQSEKEDYSKNSKPNGDGKYVKRKPITTPTRFYREDPLLPMAHSDKNCHYVPRNRLSNNGSFSERMNMSETGSFGRLRQSYGKGLDRRFHLKSSFQGTLSSEPYEEGYSDKKQAQCFEEMEVSQLNSSELLATNSKRRYHPIDRSIDFIVDIEKVIDPLHEAATSKKTTLMIRNIPNKYTQEMMIDLINKNHKDLYDFFYLPIDFKVVPGLMTRTIAM